MKQNYKLSHQLVAYTLLTSLFLQSCANFSNSFVPRIEEASNKIKKPASQLSIIEVKELLAKPCVAAGGHLVTFHEEGDKLAEVKMNALTGFSRTYTGLEVILSPDINLQQLAQLHPKTQKRHIQVQVPKNNELGHVLVCRNGVLGGMMEEEEGQTNEQADRGRVNKRRRLLSEKKASKDSEEARFLEDSPVLPPELLQMILAHVAYPDILDCRRVNRFFYELITGYAQVGLVGIGNKPAFFFYSPRWMHNRAIGFSKSKFKSLSPETMPSFFFYRLMGKVNDLPLPFWPYIQNTQIHTLDLSSTEIDAARASKLALALPNTHIHTLDLDSNRIDDEGASKLALALPNTQLHTLYLSYNQIGAAGVSKLALVLPNTQVCTLDLDDNQIGAAGASKLAQALPNTHMHTLNLSRNQIGAEGVTKLSEALLSAQIRTLNLNSNQIGDEGASTLALALPSTQIHTLTLDNNVISAEGASQLAKALPHTHIHTLDLSDNEIGVEGTSQLAEALPHTHIHTLDLSYNQIGAEGASQLAKVLPNAHIHTLYLNNNHIGAEGASQLAKVLPNAHIHTLYLNSNRIGDEGASKLAKVLPNTHIHTLSLYWNQVGDVMQRLLQQQNPNIKFVF